MIPKILTLVRGLPGSGKSTFANTITNEFSVCEADKFFYDKEGNYNFDATKLRYAQRYLSEGCTPVEAYQHAYYEWIK
jgi:adenylate kinase family enzyme